MRPLYDPRAHWEFAEGSSSPEAKCTRNILDADTLANSVELFVKLNWLPLHLEVKVNICIQNYKRVNGHSPSCMHMNDLLV